MSQTKEIALRCRISRGGFSGERVVHINQADNKEYVGLAPTHYCWTGDQKPLGLDQPPPSQQIEGLVAARLLRDLNDRAVVTIPDGEVFIVSKVIITKRPESEVVSNVPI